MSLKQEFELLRRVPLFAEIEPSRLKLLAFMSERVGYDPGRLIVRQGDTADAAYLIIEGHAEVVAETPAGPVILATLGANETVGEMGILTNMPRNATVRAKDRVDCIAHLEGAVYAYGARIPEHFGLDHAGIGAPARCG